jgi:energy-coupling factor transporter ATP-binding protein EcfA2
VITEIEIEGFKSLEKVRLKLGKLNLFVGTNASGKSNFFDALRVLQGAGYGLTLDEIFNGKPKSSTNEVWEGIRGGTSFAAFMRRGELRPSENDSAIKFSVALQAAALPLFEYEFRISPKRGEVLRETLFAGAEEILCHEKAVGALLATSGMRNVPDDLKPQFTLDRRLLHASLSRALGNMQKLDPHLSVLRTYSQFKSVKRMGENGENFAALVQAILTQERLHSAYLSWLRQLTPIELDDVTILTGALEEPLFALKEGVEEFPAPILSDGTLRFAALAAAFFQPDMPDIITIEEIENGIHPTRLRLLVELLKSQSVEGGPQVFATTHSPVVLAWLEENDYDTTFFCKRDEETGASIIKPLSEIPHLVDIVKKRSLGELFTQGWMEMAL